MEVFCSYAHKDEALLRELKAHLSSLQRQNQISLWYDRLLAPGTDWAREIDEHLNSATLILLLISADFLASDYCYGLEMQRALERHAVHKARVVPVILRPVDWQDEPLARLQALPTDGRPITSWSDRDEALTDVARGLRKVLADLAKPAASVPPTLLPPVWQVPFPRNPFFTGRQDVLTHLCTQLQSGQRAAIGQTQALSGLGGIGKTQLAVEYAYRYQQAYQTVLWAQAENEETLNASYAKIAALLELSEQDARDQSMLVQAVKSWLQRHRAWLLILDNADQPEMLLPFLPPVVGGHVLITTRATALGGLELGVTQPLMLATFTREEGAHFLLHRAGLFVRASEQDRQIAHQISEELGDLPLALDQAGAYLEATGSDLDTYRQIYQQRQAELLGQRHSSSHPDPVATTWSLSMQRIEEDKPAAAQLLHFCAFLAPDAIPAEMFSAGAQHLGSVLAPVVADAYQLNEAIAALRAYSLINRDPQEHTLSVHRLVQFVVRNALPTSRRQQWEKRAVLALQAAFPEGDFANWSICERLLPHALLYANWTGQGKSVSLRAASLHFRAGYYLIERGRYVEAERFLRQALSTRERLVGTGHPDVAVCLNSLGVLFVKQGKYAAAEPFFARALDIAQTVHGPAHPIVASGINNLAVIYEEQGKCEEAEELYQRALTIGRQQPGPENPVIARYLNNLAKLYLRREQREKAESFLQNALALSEQHLGSEHPQNAPILNNLGYLYGKQERYAEAEVVLLRALDIEEKHLGINHVEMAETLYNLGYINVQMGNHAKADQLLQSALTIYQDTVGPEHPDTQNAEQYYARFQQITQKKRGS